MVRRKVYSYDVNDEFDRVQIFDLPFNQLNATGRRKKKRFCLKVK